MTKNSRAANACKISILLLFSSILLGCNFAPSYQQPQDVVAATVPDATPAPALAPAVLAAAQADALQWLADDRLRHTVALALHNNRDLRIAADNVAKARAQYGIARADQLPSITAQLQGQRSRSSADVSNSTRLVNEQVSASIGFASYEVDLWGRIRNLNAAAWQQFLQVQENRRGVEIALIAEVANAWLTLAADQERLALAQQTLDTREQSYALMRRMFQLGATSGLALAQNLGTVETARGDAACTPRSWPAATMRCSCWWGRRWRQRPSHRQAGCKRRPRRFGPRCRRRCPPVSCWPAPMCRPLSML